MAGVVTLPTLKLGSTGVAVNELQRLLVKVGVWETGWWGSLDVNIFGPVTAQGVSKFQESQHIPVSGVADDATWTALYVIAGEGKIVSAPIVSAMQRGTATSLLAAQQAAAAQNLAAQQHANAEPSMLPKIILAGGVFVAAYFVYKKIAKAKGTVDGIAFVDDGEDDAGPAFRPSPRARAALRALDDGMRAAPRTKRRAPRRLAAGHPLNAELVGTASVAPKRKWGRKAVNILRDPDTEEEFESDPGPTPAIIRLDADEKRFKSTKQYREDMKRLAWDRARANNTAVHVVARGTARALYKAEP